MIYDYTVLSDNGIIMIKMYTDDMMMDYLRG